MDLKTLTPKEIRQLIRENKLKTSTSGLGEGYVQANLAIVPADYAFEFLLFCHRNPKPCPIVDVLEPGVYTPNIADADIRTDISRYRIFENGELVAETNDIVSYWRDDFVTFLIGCSFTFERALVEAGIEMLHQKTESKFVPVYETNIECKSAGRFHGPMVVSMRPIKKVDLVKAVEITAKYPHTHGSPIHIGDPSLIGIEDITKPDHGEFVPYSEEYVPVFWACGVTPQAVAMRAKPPIMITHAAGHMFISDQKEEL